ncbi:MAG TPA: hypothetical protein VL403_16635 [Candidatus Kryptonia bacterium]|nr:hypothetical protein [Candidatus Kryptonia bacterium]
MAAKTTTAGRRRDRRASSATLTQLTILDAVRTWVVPAVTAPLALVLYVLFNVEVIEREAAVSALGLLVIVTVLWIGVRGFISERTGTRLAALLTAYVAVWSIATALPFLAIVNPGPPLFKAPLHANESVTLPVAGHTESYRLVVEGGFAPSAGQSARLAHYRLTLSGSGSGEQVLEGNFSERFLQQRLGRRGTATVRDLHTATQHSIEAAGQPLMVTLNELAPPDVIASLTIQLFPERFPQLLFLGLGVVLVAASAVVDRWRPRDQTEGLMTTVTLGTLLSIVALRWWGGPHPGFGQLAVEGLLGGVAGSVVAMVLHRIGQPLLRRLPSAP